MKEEEEEDLNDREVDDEDEEGEFNSVWCKLGARALIKTNPNNHRITQMFILMFISVSRPKI